MELLIVDDDYAVRAAVRRALALEGYEVSMASSGEEAIELLGEGRWDAVILDILMGGLSGLEVCRRLRAAGDRTPILMLTARETIKDRVAGLETGADDYLVKPFALEELLARVKALLRRSPLIILLSVEVMLNSANLLLIAFSRLHGREDGQRDRQMAWTEDERSDDPRDAAPVCLLRRQRTDGSLCHVATARLPQPRA